MSVDSAHETTTGGRIRLSNRLIQIPISRNALETVLLGMKGSLLACRTDRYASDKK